MKKKTLQFLVVLSSLIFVSFNVYAHCEIPCGIYDDEMRIRMISEHITTIEKSMNEIMKIEKTSPHHSNQLIRWVMNKERHADDLQEIVAQYFMTQRIKEDAKEYEKKIRLLHQLLLYSMKCKQTTDLSHVEKLRNFLKDFQTLYFAEK